MTPVGRGEDWGAPAPIPDGAIWVATDAAAADVVGDSRRRGDAIPPLVLSGGDLARTLGGAGDRSRLERGKGTRVTVDVGAALVDGRLSWFVAHLVARRGWWRGRILAVCNAAFHGPWNVAPKAHPGDGKLDVVDADLALRDRLAARRRLRSGTHVPHPRISVRRTAAIQFEFDRDLDIHLDRHEVGRARALSVRIEPAALDIWI